jgi:glycosyltransferase involved in cell wall biosynthesis
MEVSMTAGAEASLPTVSVVIPVWNCRPYVTRALDSVLNQKFNDIEVLVVDDCSTDGTSEILRSYKDPRIRVLSNDENMGISRSLMRGIEASRGAYIARMDGDDICFKSRFDRQVRFLDKHRDVDVVGGSAVLIGRFPWRLKTVKRHDRAIKAQLIFHAPMIHPSVMFRRSAQMLRYDPDIHTAEDYDLWVRMAKAHAKFGNLGLPVIFYRVHRQRTSEVRAEEQTREGSEVRRRLLAEFLERDIEVSEEVALVALGARRIDDIDVLRAAVRLSHSILSANHRQRIVDPVELRRRLTFEMTSSVFGEHRRYRLSQLSANDLADVWRLVRRHPVMCVAGLARGSAKRALIAASKKRNRGTGDAGS